MLQQDGRLRTKDFQEARSAEDVRMYRGPGRESLDFSVMRCRLNSEGFCASFCNRVNSLREEQWQGLRGITKSH